MTATVAADLANFPGGFTTTEAHRTIRLGATGLKFFPSALIGAEGIKAIRATLPADTQICAGGGVGPADFATYRSAGVLGFGLGSNLYRPGTTQAEIATSAAVSVRAFREV